MTVLQVEDVKQLVFPVLLHQSDSAQIHGPLWQFRLYDNASALGGPLRRIWTAAVAASALQRPPLFVATRLFTNLQFSYSRLGASFVPQGLKPSGYSR